jgi:hypothetical protein
VTNDSEKDSCRHGRRNRDNRRQRRASLCAVARLDQASLRPGSSRSARSYALMPSCRSPWLVWHSPSMLMAVALRGSSRVAACGAATGARLAPLVQSAHA